MRIVIAEDAALFRAGLVRLLEDEGHQVCAAVADGDALLAAVAAHRPDVVVADIRMPPSHTDEGLRAALELRRTHPRTASTGRWSASCWPPAVTPGTWTRSPPASATCSP